MAPLELLNRQLRNSVIRITRQSDFARLRPESASWLQPTPSIYRTGTMLTTRMPPPAGIQLRPWQGTGVPPGLPVSCRAILIHAFHHGGRADRGPSRGRRGILERNTQRSATGTRLRGWIFPPEDRVLSTVGNERLQVTNDVGMSEMKIGGEPCVRYSSRWQVCFLWSWSSVQSQA